jgi:6-phosphogluconolactonase
VALSGGSTPRALHALLAAEPYARELPWSSVRFFWGDERCVPARSPRSNYRMARETLLQPLQIPPAHVFRMRGEREPRDAAAEYTDTLASQLGPDGRLDLVLLGMGPDGHTASLFPGSRALRIVRRRVAANWVAKLGEWRLTMTYPTFNSARRVLFLVTGTDKRPAARRILTRQPGWRGLPASGIRPSSGSLVWLLDEAAGGDL